MKILVFDVPASDGGALSVLQEFFEYINSHEKEHQWIFIVSVDKLNSTSKNVKILKFPETKHNWGKRIYFELFKAKKIIQKEKPDIIFSLQNTALLWTKIPQIIYLHQTLPFIKCKRFSIFKKEERFLAIYRQIFKYLIGWSIKKSSGIIVQTNWVKNAVIELYKTSGQKIFVIPTYVKFNAEIKDVQIDKNKFFYPTAPFVYKNIQVIIDAVRILVDKGYNPKVYLTINGNENEHSKKIYKQIEKNTAFVLIGKISRESVMNYYKFSTLLFPSYLESLGLPLLEARIMKTNIIASDMPFSHEILDNYKYVQYFDAFNPIDLANKMLYILDNERCINESSYDIQIEEKYSINNTWGAVVKLISNFE